MNKENFRIGEKCKNAVTIHNKLKEFKETRAIATAVEICDMIIKEWADEDIWPRITRICRIME